MSFRIKCMIYSDTTMSLWVDRTIEFKNITYKHNPKLLTKKGAKKADSVIVKNIKQNVLTRITELLKAIEANESQYLYTMDFGGRSKFESSCEDMLKMSASSLKTIESALEMHFRNGVKQYPQSYVDHYNQVIALTKSYYQIVLKRWTDLQTRRSLNADFQRRAKSLSSGRPLEGAAIQKPQTPIEQPIEEDLNVTISDDENDNFQDEQAQMMMEFNEKQKDVEQIGKTVQDIAKMQLHLTEQVGMQQEVVENIHQDVDDATNNIQRGNLEIRNAIQNNATTRAAMIFFLFMSSFLLLVLDWYS